MPAWRVPDPIDVPDDLRAAVGGQALVAEILYRRGVRDARSAQAFLDPRLYRPADALEMPGMAGAVSLLAEAIRHGEPICVWGDFDVDGQTSTSLLVATLRDLGARVSYHIPVRETESHGINLPGLKDVIASGARVLLTCDTGVSAAAEVEYARKMGMRVVITDHHELPEVLPAADAVVDPRLLPKGHPLGGLPGVGVAYQLSTALYTEMGRAGGEAQYLDLVALGIVADLAPLSADTRYLLQLGLEVLRNTRRAGLRRMMALAEVITANLTEETIGFILGPRLNALGRLSDANPAVEFLTTEDETSAAIFATELEGLNARRKLLSDQVLHGAQALLEQDPALIDFPVLVLGQATWPAGVVGIVASRLVELYQKPVILLSAPAGGTAHGSARSIEGCDITALIASQKDMLLGYGGHPMAAGLAIETERIPDFRRGIAREVTRSLGNLPGAAALQIDGSVRLSDLKIEQVIDLERLAPFGPSNPALTLTSPGLSLVKASPVGRNGEHLSILLQDERGQAYKAIWWQAAGNALPEGRFELAYTARTNVFRGQPQLQIEWIDSHAEQGIVLHEPKREKIVVHDFRVEVDAFAVFARLAQDGPVQTWGEGIDRPAILMAARNALSAGPRLVIWSCPPGSAELNAVLQKVKPKEVFLFAQSAGYLSPKAFLERLAGLIKYAQRAYGGKIEIDRLAGSTAQREETVRTGILWLAAKGYIRVQSEEDGRLQISTNGAQNADQAAQLEALIKAQLAETAAYRDYYCQAVPDALIGR